MPIQKAALQAGGLKLTINGDDFVVTREKDEALSMRMESKRPWRLERCPSDLHLETSLSEARYSPEIAALRAKLRRMVEQDQSARLAFDDKKVDDVDARNGRSCTGSSIGTGG